MIKFRAKDFNGIEFEGYGVLQMDKTRKYILFLERGYYSDINEGKMNIPRVYVKKETIEMIVV